jgi:hypothetical protein
MARRRALEPSSIALIGGVLAIISCFLAWDGYHDSFDVPLRFLWDKDATGGVKLGIPLVAVAGVVALFSVSAIEPFVFLRRLGGVALLAATALFVVQLGRRIGWDNLSADNVDTGPYLAGVGLAFMSRMSAPWLADAARPGQASRMIVTGPSFTSSSCMRALKTPVSTWTPSSRRASQKRS